MTFVDTDGDAMEYRVNPTSGKLDCLESGKLKFAGLGKCEREGATILYDHRQTTAPDEETAQRVIELFQYCSAKARLQMVLIA